MDNPSEILKTAEDERLECQESKIDCPDLLEKVRILEQDHEPEGWPAIRMRDVSALAQMVEGAKRLRHQPYRVEWNPDGYWLDGNFVGSLEAAFYEAGK